MRGSSQLQREKTTYVFFYEAEGICKSLFGHVTAGPTYAGGQSDNTLRDVVSSQGQKLSHLLGLMMPLSHSTKRTLFLQLLLVDLL